MSNETKDESAVLDDVSELLRELSPYKLNKLLGLFNKEYLRGFRSVGRDFYRIQNKSNPNDRDHDIYNEQLKPYLLSLKERTREIVKESPEHFAQSLGYTMGLFMGLIEYVLCGPIQWCSPYVEMVASSLIETIDIVNNRLVQRHQMSNIEKEHRMIYWKRTYTKNLKYLKY